MRRHSFYFYVWRFFWPEVHVLFCRSLSDMMSWTRLVRLKQFLILLLFGSSVTVGWKPGDVLVSVQMRSSIITVKVWKWSAVFTSLVLQRKLVSQFHLSLLEKSRITANASEFPQQTVGRGLSSYRPGVTAGSSPLCVINTFCRKHSTTGPPPAVWPPWRLKK